ncbi:MAG: phosphoribosylglycinamide formyltransferase [Rhodospirillales bacterium]|jgi:phosphoribosylglycinamide formyltransferase 1|nr:phosphoribosylglycinamide formyltransferase [Rhodospirillales bacterium]
MARRKLAVLISGRGSNLQSLIDACKDPDYPAQIALVISNKPDVFGLKRAEEAGVPTLVIDHRDFDGRESFEDALHEAISASKPDYVCLAGFMRILTDGFVTRWHNRLINIHPSLLPSFKGLHTHERALEAGVRFAGCTIHFVRPAMDDGPIIIQAAVPVRPNDDADTLAARVLEQEHKIYPLAVRLIAEGRVRVAHEKVTITDAELPEGAILNPAGP